MLIFGCRNPQHDLVVEPGDDVDTVVPDLFAARDPPVEHGDLRRPAPLVGVDKDVLQYLRRGLGLDAGEAGALSAQVVGRVQFSWIGDGGTDLPDIDSGGRGRIWGADRGADRSADAHAALAEDEVDVAGGAHLGGHVAVPGHRRLEYDLVAEPGDDIDLIILDLFAAREPPIKCGDPRRPAPFIGVDQDVLQQRRRGLGLDGGPPPGVAGEVVGGVQLPRI